MSATAPLWWCCQSMGTLVSPVDRSRLTNLGLGLWPTSGWAGFGVGPGAGAGAGSGAELIWTG